MSSDLEDLKAIIDRALANEQLFESAAKNIRALLGGDSANLYIQSVTELVQSSAWDELNDRFYKTLAFGTGGLRGRTIGKIVTSAERSEERRVGKEGRSRW